MSLIERVKNTNLINNNDRIIVGVSGGPDSMCLLDILVKLKSDFNLTLFVVHINHSLRVEADYEEEYVKKVALNLGLEFFSKKVDINKLAKEGKKSTEEIARGVRYDFFEEISNKVNANKIAIAHNQNDNTETVLMNILRGCGIDGLCGIRERNGKIIRPLLKITRSEIENYIEENNLVTMQDKTNLESVYTRNKVRNELIPYLKNFNPDIVCTISKMSELVNCSREIVNKVVLEKYNEVKEALDGVILNREKFLSLDINLKREVIRLAIFNFKGDLVDVSMKTIDNAIYIISTAQSGRIVKILPNVKIKISYNKLIFFNTYDKEDFLYELNIPGKTYIKELDKTITAKIVSVSDVLDDFKNPNKSFFDIEKTGKKLYVRNKRAGDFFEPCGMNGKKTIKKYFSDLKIDESKRDKIPILTTENEIVWIVGYRVSRKFLKDKYTKEVIIFEYGENI